MADVLYISLGVLLLLLSFVGCFFPVLPGPVVAYLSLFAAFGVGSGGNPPTSVLVVAGLATAIVVVLDYVVPTLGARKFNCSRAGTIGCVVGTFLGIFYAAYGGILLGPFLGALLGELLFAGRPLSMALKGAFGAFLGFMAGMVMKVFCCLMMAALFAASCVFNLWD